MLLITCGTAGGLTAFYLSWMASQPKESAEEENQQEIEDIIAKRYQYGKIKKEEDDGTGADQVNVQRMEIDEKNPQTLETYAGLMEV